MTSQTRYMREVRKCSLVRTLEAEQQRKRRHTLRYRELNRLYQRRYRQAHAKRP